MTLGKSFSFSSSLPQSSHEADACLPLKAVLSIGDGLVKLQVTVTTEEEKGLRSCFPTNKVHT